MKDIEELFEKYLGKREGEVSREFKLFLRDERTEFMKKFEKLCRWAGRIIQVKLDERERKRLESAIAITGMKVRPEDVGALSLLSLLFMVILTSILALIAFLFNLLTGIVPFIILGLGVGAVFAHNYIRKLPISLIEQRRVRASNELVLAVLYIVSYMRHTSNLEEAVRFAASNLEGPLANDFTKLIWDIQARKYSDINDALNHYVMNWKEFSPEFVDAIYLIRSTLYQSDEANRISLLNEAVERILDGTYRRMINYASSLRNPINTLYMLGIVLPVLGMVMFPMLSTFFAKSVSVFSIAVGYNVILPLIVAFLAKNVLKNRPSGFPYTDISKHPNIPKRHHFFFGKRQYPSIIPAALVALIFIAPSIYALSFIQGVSELQVYLSIPIVFGLGVGVYVHTKLSTARAVELLKQVRDVEEDFAHAAFQLGTILMQDIPPEQAFVKVSDSMKGSRTAAFLGKVVNNVKRLGMSIRDALFEKKEGAVWMYPSPIIKSTMQVLVDTSKKSLKDAGIALVFISKYLRNIKNVDDKVRDALDEVLSSMHFQVVFLGPIISGIVVGMTALITLVLTILGERITNLAQLLGTGGAQGVPSLFFVSGLFNMTQTTPLHLFQLMVGLYTIEIIIIIGYMISNIERPGDPYYRDFTISRMILIPLIIYSIVTSAITMILGGLARLAIGVSEVFA